MSTVKNSGFLAMTVPITVSFSCGKYLFELKGRMSICILSRFCLLSVMDFLESILNELSACRYPDLVATYFLHSLFWPEIWHLMESECVYNLMDFPN